MSDVVLRGSFDASQQRHYHHVPFEVPTGVRSIHVAYDYSERIPSDPQLLDGDTLDIGVFDPRGIAQSSPGFRGWSGSHKLEFTIAENWATPPYSAGPIQPVLNRAFGPYGWLYWLLLLCNVGVAQLLWFKQVRTGVVPLFVV